MSLPKSVETIFILVDISGYTKFMISNRRSLDHAQVIITELLNTLIHQVVLPLKVAEIEGDAIFLYAVKEGSQSEWEQARKCIGQTLESFSDVFYTKLNELIATSPCSCNACHNMERLKVKVVAHSGTAIINMIDKFLKISGVDTIIAHRLLKNSIPSDDYIYTTDAAFKDLEFSKPECFTEHTESYEDVGTIHGKVCLSSHIVDTETVQKKRPNFFARISLIFRSAVILLFLKLGIKKRTDVSLD